MNPVNPFIAGLDHVQLAMPPGAEAEELAVTFYEGALGIPRVDKPAVLAARGGCWFERPPLRIHLGVEADFRPARKAHPALTVVDLRTVIARLEASGVTVRPADAPVEGFDQRYIDDPFGNRIELIERDPTNDPRPTRQSS